MKKLLWAALILVLLFLGGGIWLWQKYGAFLKMKPSEPFDLAQAPPAPDYSQESNWVALPTMRDEADLVPDGTAGGDAQAGAEADVFFISPTAYLLPTWNSPIDPGSRAREITEWFVASEASAFNGCCKVHVPDYRQATFFSFLDKGRDGPQALQLAYEDVRAAFRYFIEHYSQDRPFLIASHSQGTLHAYRLMREEIDGSPLRRRFVAAYALGYPFPVADFERDFVNLDACDAPTDTGCVIAWETWAEGTEPGFFAFPLWNGERIELATAEIDRRLCVNPLSWTTGSERAEAELHLGALVMPAFPAADAIGEREHRGTEITALDRPLPNHTHARCSDNALHVAEQADPPYRSMIDAGNYHIHDFHLFYMNIRENAIARTRAWLDANPLK